MFLMRIRPSSLFSTVAISLCLLGCVRTSAPLVFPGNILSSKERAGFLGTYSNTNPQGDRGVFVQITENNGNVHLRHCLSDDTDGGFEDFIIISKIPEQEELYVFSPVNGFFVNDDLINGHDVILFRTENAGVRLWTLDKTSNITEEYLDMSESEENNGSVLYPVERVQKFLIEYGEAYTLANESGFFIPSSSSSFPCT